MRSPLLPEFIGRPKRRRSPHSSSTSYAIVCCMYGLLLTLVFLVFVWMGARLSDRCEKINEYEYGPVQVSVSSFLVLSSPNPNPADPVWESKLSLVHTGLVNKSFGVSYDAQVSVFFRKGYFSTVHVHCPLIHAGWRSNTGWEAIDIAANLPVDAGLTRDRVAMVDLMMEVNATEKLNWYYLQYLEKTSFLMINCFGLKIEFSENPRLGWLSAGGRNCNVRRCASRADVYNGRRKTCRNIYDKLVYKF